MGWYYKDGWWHNKNHPYKFKSKYIKSGNTYYHLNSDGTKTLIYQNSKFYTKVSSDTERAIKSGLVQDVDSNKKLAWRLDTGSINAEHKIERGVGLGTNYRVVTDRNGKKYWVNNANKTVHGYVTGADNNTYHLNSDGSATKVNKLKFVEKYDGNLMLLDNYTADRGKVFEDQFYYYFIPNNSGEVYRKSKKVDKNTKFVKVNDNSDLTQSLVNELHTLNKKYEGKVSSGNNNWASKAIGWVGDQIVPDSKNISVQNRDQAIKAREMNAETASSSTNLLQYDSEGRMFYTANKNASDREKDLARISTDPLYTTFLSNITGSTRNRRLVVFDQALNYLYAVELSIKKYRGLVSPNELNTLKKQLISTENYKAGVSPEVYVRDYVLDKKRKPLNYSTQLILDLIELNENPNYTPVAIGKSADPKLFQADSKELELELPWYSKALQGAGSLLTITNTVGALNTIVPTIAESVVNGDDIVDNLKDIAELWYLGGFKVNSAVGAPLLPLPNRSLSGVNRQYSQYKSVIDPLDNVTNLVGDLALLAATGGTYNTVKGILKVPAKHLAKTFSKAGGKAAFGGKELTDILLTSSKEELKPIAKLMAKAAGTSERITYNNLILCLRVIKTSKNAGKEIVGEASKEATSNVVKYSFPKRVGIATKKTIANMFSPSGLISMDAWGRFDNVLHDMGIENPFYRGLIGVAGSYAARKLTEGLLGKMYKPASGTLNFTGLYESSLYDWLDNRSWMGRWLTPRDAPLNSFSEGIKLARKEAIAQAEREGVKAESELLSLFKGITKTAWNNTKSRIIPEVIPELTGTGLGLGAYALLTPDGYYNPYAEMGAMMAGNLFTGSAFRLLSSKVKGSGNGYADMQTGVHNLMHGTSNGQMFGGSGSSNSISMMQIAAHNLALRQFKLKFANQYDALIKRAGLTLHGGKEAYLLNKLYLRLYNKNLLKLLQLALSEKTFVEFTKILNDAVKDETSSLYTSFHLGDTRLVQENKGTFKSTGNAFKPGSSNNLIKGNRVKEVLKQLFGSDKDYNKIIITKEDLALAQYERKLKYYKANLTAKDADFWINPNNKESIINGLINRYKNKNIEITDEDIALAIKNHQKTPTLQGYATYEDYGTPVDNDIFYSGQLIRTGQNILLNEASTGADAQRALIATNPARSGHGAVDKILIGKTPESKIFDDWKNITTFDTNNNEIPLFVKLNGTYKVNPKAVRMSTRNQDPILGFYRGLPVYNNVNGSHFYHIRHKGVDYRVVMDTSGYRATGNSYHTGSSLSSQFGYFLDRNGDNVRSIVIQRFSPGLSKTSVQGIGNVSKNPVSKRWFDFNRITHQFTKYGTFQRLAKLYIHGVDRFGTAAAYKQKEFMEFLQNAKKLLLNLYLSVPETNLELRKQIESGIKWLEKHSTPETIGYNTRMDVTRSKILLAINSMILAKRQGVNKKLKNELFKFGTITDVVNDVTLLNTINKHLSPTNSGQFRVFKNLIKELETLDVGPVKAIKLKGKKNELVKVLTEIHKNITETYLKLSPTLKRLYKGLIDRTLNNLLLQINSIK